MKSLPARLSEEEIKTLYKLREIIVKFNSDELKVFSYVWDNISVGEILFERDLNQIHGVNKPILAAASLREKGVIERGEGCYNLARWLRPLRKKIGSFQDLRLLLDKLP
ncbi:PolB1-binding protein PBP2 family protein [Pyrodictium abyssi]|uniref:PolB1-binding protein PBP2 family protein n=1 Tax=Pyrodictium abyssi TaxID=54256 RepID=UPI0030C65FE2